MNKPIYFNRLQQIFYKKKSHEYTIKKMMPWYIKNELNSTRRIRNDYIDFDYIHILNKEERAFLKTFNSEYNNASFEHKGSILQNKEAELDCYNKNNARNRDIYALLKCRGLLLTFGIEAPDTQFTEFEDELIDYLDSKKT